MMSGKGGHEIEPRGLPSHHAKVAVSQSTSIEESIR
jgi:hypothetical protein